MRNVVVLIASVSFAAACRTPRQLRDAPPKQPWQSAGFVAHAFGSPTGGPIYTNSREAFESSYAKGFRAFETDLVLLKDGRVLLAHDGRESHYGLPEGTTFDELTSEAMRGRSYDGKYAVLFGEDLVALMQRHDDATVLLDTKGHPETTQVAIAKRLMKLAPPAVQARMVPHVHSEEQLAKLRKLGTFGEYILALYLWRDRDVDEAPDVVRKERLRTVIVRPRDYTDELRDALLDAGARWVFVHSFTTKQEIVPWRRNGLGVYSNDWIGPA
jgi:glycerophosphoryl diester phosphodiesterase